MPRLPLLTALCAFATGLFAAEPQLVLHDGDRVLLIGDVLMERENNFGYLETKMRREFPGRNFAVRNLGYSGDSPWVRRVPASTPSPRASTASRSSSPS